MSPFNALPFKVVFYVTVTCCLTKVLRFKQFASKFLLFPRTLWQRERTLPVLRAEYRSGNKGGQTTLEGAWRVVKIPITLLPHWRILGVLPCLTGMAQNT